MTGWLITGAGGMLGQELTGALRQAGEQVTALDRAGLDVTDPAAVTACLAAASPAVVVNCAAWTAVDLAEEYEAAALAVNGTGAANLAAACARTGARLVQISTDYVFGAAGRGRYAEDDPPAPLNAYGRTKLAGERAALEAGGWVVRTAWLYGTHGPNFVRAMLGRARAGAAVTVVDDQYGQPTWTAEVAGRVLALARAGAAPGVYHATSTGSTTWCGLARAVYRLAGADPALVTPVTTAAYPRPAPRPGCSVLGHDGWARAGLAAPAHWADALGQAFPALETVLTGTAG